MAIYGGQPPSDYYARQDARKDDKFRDIINLFMQLNQAKEQKRQFNVGAKQEEEKMKYMGPYYESMTDYRNNPPKSKQTSIDYKVTYADYKVANGEWTPDQGAGFKAGGWSPPDEDPLPVSIPPSFNSYMTDLYQTPRWREEMGSKQYWDDYDKFQSLGGDSKNEAEKLSALHRGWDKELVSKLESGVSKMATSGGMTIETPAGRRFGIPGQEKEVPFKENIATSVATIRNALSGGELSDDDRKRAKFLNVLMASGGPSEEDVTEINTLAAKYNVSPKEVFNIWVDYRAMIK